MTSCRSRSSRRFWPGKRAGSRPCAGFFSPSPATSRSACFAGGSFCANARQRAAAAECGRGRGQCRRERLQPGGTGVHGRGDCRHARALPPGRGAPVPWRGWECRTIAHELAISEQTVRVQLARAMEKCAQYLRDRGWGRARREPPVFMAITRAGGAAPPTSIEDVAADWLARREAGLSVDEQAEFSRWLLADAAHANAVRRLEPPGGGSEVTLHRAGRRSGAGRRTPGGAAREAHAQASACRCGPRDVGDRGGARGRLSARAAVSAGKQPGGGVGHAQAGATAPGGWIGGRTQRGGGDRGGFLGGAARCAGWCAAWRTSRAARDPARPFVVTAGLVAVCAVGTEFAVQFAPGEVDVLVTEGRGGGGASGLEPVAAGARQ